MKKTITITKTKTGFKQELSHDIDEYRHLDGVCDENCYCYMSTKNIENTPYVPYVSVARKQALQIGNYNGNSNKERAIERAIEAYDNFDDWSKAMKPFLLGHDIDLITIDETKASNSIAKGKSLTAKTFNYIKNLSIEFKVSFVLIISILTYLFKDDIIRMYNKMDVKWKKLLSRKR